MSSIVGVIPAAGHGTRAYPYTKGIPKCMLEVAGEPNLARTIRLMRDQMHVSRLVIVIGAFGDVIREYFGDGQQLGIGITYVVNDAIEKGLSYSILLSRPHVTSDYFCVILSDECYVNSNHHDLLSLSYQGQLALCGVSLEGHPEQILENYAVWIEHGRIRGITEKPRSAAGALLGVGTFVFHRGFYDHLERALHGPATQPNDPISILGRLCAEGASVAPFFIRGDYVNINGRDALNLANNIVRSRQFDQCSVALVLLMKGTIEDTVRTIREFHDLRRYRQTVLVLLPGVDPPAETPPGLVCVSPTSAGHGDMLRTGLDAADADILVTALSDGSCVPDDAPKLLEYLKDADFVTGTRTTRQLIQRGTEMRGIVRLAHVLLGKLLELVWWNFEPRFTDVGCAYRALWRSTYRLVRPNLHRSGAESWVEMILETLKCRKRVVEIPVKFHIRHRGMKEKEQTFRVFFSIVRLILGRRFTSPVRAGGLSASAGPNPVRG